ncbi:hypothetical protein H8356DRAFT_960323 [Neocallimastix lanati (nom. inval.)]|uniref:Uncharacterized protein n=1 Tax=Neocallimastix californiae TaxID=1754190 RepID=A0A1Y2ADL8_9FUNG|nr:hypothetical protein H8356DRAFT_960323 [Neocallimastix sp. JGI-2020a]ORY20659.1 hypothetical protein LY90DRAFT_516615 [Neocallimastix californiae]|eukprot:ORY20659.1 hypothetical protein LY90DRAFT_516615 [Neocallimastix californiae]
MITSYLGINPIFPIKKEFNDAVNKLTNEYEECDINNSTKVDKNIDDLYIPECKDSNQVAVAGIDNIMRIAYLGIKYNYEKDENNKYCPLNSLLINKNITDKAKVIDLGNVKKIKYLIVKDKRKHSNTNNDIVYEIFQRNLSDEDRLIFMVENFLI